MDIVPTPFHALWAGARFAFVRVRSAAHLHRGPHVTLRQDDAMPHGQTVA